MRRYYISTGSLHQYQNPQNTLSYDFNWRDAFDIRLQLVSGSAYVTAALSTPDGMLQYFRSDGSPVLALSEGQKMSLSTAGSGYQVQWNDDILGFDGSGRMTTVWRPGYSTLSLKYSDGTTGGPNGRPAVYPPGTLAPVPADHLIEVASSSGRVLRYARASDGRIVGIALSDSRVVSYSYDDSGQLVGVSYPDGFSKRYLYGEVGLTSGANLPFALTGIEETNNAGGSTRVATFAYDTSGRAILTQHSGGIQTYTLDFSTPPQVIVRDPLGSSRSLQFGQVQGVSQLLSSSQPAGSGCAASTSHQAFDANGNLQSRDDFTGRRTCFAHTADRQLQIAAIEGLAGATNCPPLLVAGAALPLGSIKTSTDWHPVVPQKVKVAEPGRITTHVYNGQPDPFAGGALASCAPASALLPDGKPIAVVCRRVEQATTDANGALGFAAPLQPDVAAREQRWTYNERGQVLTHDGPRNDIGDTTVYEYYTTTSFSGAPPNEVGYTIGDLKQVTNPAGHVTRYTLYDRLGQLREMIDANGVVSTYTYDARQRLTSATVGGQTTVYEYWPTGLIKKLTRPDGSWVFHEYDAAHRLMRVSDSLGNSISYTLDNAGNRIGEEVKDPSGALRRSVQREIDALGRVQQLTGRE